MGRMSDIFRDTDGAAEMIRRAFGASAPRSARLTENTDVAQAMSKVAERFPNAEWRIVCTCAVEMGLELLFKKKEREEALRRLRNEE